MQPRRRICDAGTAALLSSLPKGQLCSGNSQDGEEGVSRNHWHSCVVLIAQLRRLVSENASKEGHHVFFVHVLSGQALCGWQLLLGSYMTHFLSDFMLLVQTI
jgi:hypothetical protein